MNNNWFIKTENRTNSNKEDESLLNDFQKKAIDEAFWTILKME